MRTLEQKIGQMMMVGWQNATPDEIIENIKKYNFGNVILFTRNIRTTEELKISCARIQEAAIEYNGAPCFISIDQEGGSVRRIYNGVSKVPGAMAIAAASGRFGNASKIIGGILGAELKDIGINLNLAPVVDINSNAFNPVIAIRSFGDNPDTVSRLASEFAVGMQECGVMACYKHFLGHGAVDVDSHIDLPRIHKSLEEVKRYELIPYINAASDAIMTAHILFDKIDDKFPASISQSIIGGILRDELKYEGLVITDCFEMEGLIRTFSFEEAAYFAARAGTDIITVSHTFGRQLIVRNALIKAAKDGDLSMDIIDAANQRIDKYKKKYCEAPVQSIDKQRNQRTADDISAASVTLASGSIFDFSSDTVIVGVTNYVNSIAEDTNVEKMDVAETIGREFCIPHLSIDNKNFNLSEILDFVKTSKVILALADSHLTLVQKVLYSSLTQAGKKIMLISLRTPYDILRQDKPECHICTYEYTEQSIAALLKVLKGAKTEGILPVKLDRDNSEYMQTSLPENQIKNYLVECILNYMKINFAKKLTLNNVAYEFFISGGHLCKLLKKKTGKSFIDLLNEYRIGESKRLLKTTTLRVYEIASLCGYFDLNYFVKVFKKYVGVTPTYFRDNFSLYD